MLGRVVLALEEQVRDPDAAPGREDPLVEDPEDLLQRELPVRRDELVALFAYEMALTFFGRRIKMTLASEFGQLHSTKMFATRFNIFPDCISTAARVKRKENSKKKEKKEKKKDDSSSDSS